MLLLLSSPPLRMSAASCFPHRWRGSARLASSPMVSSLLRLGIALGDHLLQSRLDLALEPASAAVAKLDRARKSTGIHQSIQGRGMYGFVAADHLEHGVARQTFKLVVGDGHSRPPCTQSAGAGLVAW